MDPLANHGSFYYDLDGMPISLGRWAAMFEELRESGEFQIALTDVWLPGGGTARVSTVWIGLDASCGYENRPPDIFETMVFFESGNWASDGFQQKSPTREAALAVHLQAIDWAETLGVATDNDRNR